MPITYPDTSPNFNLIFQGDCFPINSYLYALYSSKFAQLLPSLTDGQFIIPANVDKNSFTSFVNACQASFYELTIDNVFEILDLVTEWEVEPVMDAIHEFLSNTDKLDLIIPEILSLIAKGKPTTTLEEAIVSQINSFLERDDLITLPLPVLTRIFQSQQCQISNMHLYFSFLQETVKLYHSDASPLFRCLRVEDLDTNEITQFTSMTEIDQTEICPSISVAIQSLLRQVNEQGKQIANLSKQLQESRDNTQNTLNEYHKKVKKAKKSISRHSKEIRDETSAAISIVEETSRRSTELARRLEKLSADASSRRSLLQSLTEKAHEIDERASETADEFAFIQMQLMAKKKRQEKEKPSSRQTAHAFSFKKPQKEIETPTESRTTSTRRHDTVPITARVRIAAAPLAAPKPAPESFVKEFDSKPFDGIFASLTEKCHGNPADDGLVNVSASSTFGNGMVKQVLEFGWLWYWATKNETDSFIEFDFKRAKVALSAYTLKTYPFGANNYHLKSWVIEGKNDGDWKVLDTRQGNDDLNGASKVKTFLLGQISEPFNKIRLRQIGPNQNGLNILALTNIEFFGNYTI